MAQLPNIENRFRDTENDITFIVVAYKKLSKRVMLQAINFHMMRRPKPPRGTEIRIVSVIR